jgi:hypothetical protein
MLGKKTLPEPKKVSPVSAREQSSSAVRGRRIRTTSFHSTEVHFLLLCCLKSKELSILRMTSDASTKIRRIYSVIGT